MKDSRVTGRTRTRIWPLASMTPDSQWNGWDGRWRQTQHSDHYADDRRYPPTPAASAVSQSTPSAAQTYTPSWENKSHVGEQHLQKHGLPSLASPYADASNCPAGDGRHSPPSSNLTATSRPGERYTSPWHSLPLDNRAQQQQQSTTPAPLSLKIPDSQGQCYDITRCGRLTEQHYTLRSSCYFTLVLTFAAL